MTSSDYVVISVGGNDFALGGSINLEEIFGNVATVVQMYLSKGIQVGNLAYVIPYSPTEQMAL